MEAFRVEVAGFERGVVAVECALAAAGFLGERASLFFDGWFVRSLLLDGGLDRIGDDGVVAVERCELSEDRCFEFVAGDAFAVAAFRSELLSAGAGVVVVGAAVAFGAHADVGALATAAAQKAREQVVAGVAATPGHVFAAFAEQPLRASERDFVDEGFV